MFLLYHKEMLYVVRRSESSDPQSADVFTIYVLATFLHRCVSRSFHWNKTKSVQWKYWSDLSIFSHTQLLYYFFSTK